MSDLLTQVSEMAVNGSIIYKLDHIATIYIDNLFYFNVYRRYNSPYNIVIQDNNYDIHLHQDYTVRTSLQNVLCLQDQQSNMFYTDYTYSFRYNGPIQNLSSLDILDMRWSEIHYNYQGVIINVNGLYSVEYPVTEIPLSPPFIGVTAVTAVNVNDIYTETKYMNHQIQPEMQIQDVKNYTVLRSGKMIQKV